jgi:hypothetical protein
VKRILGYCGPQHILLDNNMEGPILIDTERQAAVWRYQNQMAFVRGDGWAWAEVDRVVGKPGPSATRYKAFQIPSREVLQAIERREKSAPALLAEGEPVSLDLQVLATPVEADWTQRFQEQLRAALEGSGHPVKEEARVRVHVSVTEHDNGGVLEYARQFGLGGRTIGPTVLTIPDRYLTVKIEYRDDAGQVINERAFGAAVAHVVTERENTAQYYLDARWKHLMGSLGATYLPRKIIPPQKLPDLGSSIINENGETIMGN